MKTGIKESYLDLDACRNALVTGRGEGVRVAVLDSGIECDHPDLNGLSLTDDIAFSVEGSAITTVPGNGEDMFGHGTAIAGIIRRLAPEAEIGSVRVLGNQLRSRTKLIERAAHWAFEHGYHAVNCSFGCRVEQLVLQYKNWVDQAYLRGVHVVAASNNIDYRFQEWPAHFSSVISVKGGSISDPLRYQCIANHLVEFVLPGEDIEVAWRGGVRKRVTGSSFAAPHMAALLARLLSKLPLLSPLEAKAALKRLCSEVVSA